jgi:hypothetical protein
MASGQTAAVSGEWRVASQNVPTADNCQRTVASGKWRVASQKARTERTVVGGQWLVASHKQLTTKNCLCCHLPFAFLYGLFLFSATAAQSQEPGVPAQPAEVRSGGMCAVEGHAVKSTTGEGLRKMTIEMELVEPTRPITTEEDRQIHSTTTDANGHFLFSDLEPGRYVLTASGNGYPQQSYGQQGRRRQPKVLVLSAGQHETDVVFRLQPAGVITGAVSDEDGDSVVNAQVQALRMTHQGKREQVMGVSGAQTNDRGEYRIFGLEPGHYLVAVSYQPQQHFRRFPGVVAANDAGDDVYVPTFFPSTQDPSQASPVQVEAGDEVGNINVDLKLVHGVRVCGKVQSGGLNTSGYLQGIYVSLAPRDLGFDGYPMGNYGTNVQDKTGAFEIHGVPPGAYSLSANWSDGKRQYYGRADVDVDSTNLDGITLIMGTGIELHGRFRTDSDAKLDFGRLNLWLQPQPSDNSPGAGGAQVKPDGTFVIENLYDGSYKVHVGGFPEEYYVKSAKLGGIEVLETGLNISHSQVVGQLEIFLTLDGGRVDGTVLEEQKPFGDALVVLVPDPPLRNREELYSFKRSDSLGRFSMLGLPPGDFKLFAWEPVDGINYSDPDYIKLYESHGTRVHIEERRQQNVQLEVIQVEEEPQE